jgi:hypothetical protein
MSHLNADHSASDLGRRQIKSQNVAALSVFFLVFNQLVAVSATQRLLDPIPPSSKAQSVQEKREAVGAADQVDQTIYLRLRYAPQNPTVRELYAPAEAGAQRIVDADAIGNAQEC